MTEKYHKEIDDWEKRNGLTRRAERVLLLETWRRINMYHKGNINDTMVLLSIPSDVKQTKGLFIPYSNEIPKALNWYNLTKKGQEIIKDLNLVWNEKEMNYFIYNL